MKEITVDYMLRATWQAVARMYNEEAKKFGYTMAVGFTLLSIDPKSGTPSTALGPKMGMEPTSLSRILKSMEQKGLIVRKPNPKDGRGVLIHVTDLGLEFRERSKGKVLQFNEEVRSRLSRKEMETFFKSAETILEVAQDQKIFEQNNINKSA